MSFSEVHAKPFEGLIYKIKGTISHPIVCSTVPIYCNLESILITLKAKWNIQFRDCYFTLATITINYLRAPKIMHLVHAAFLYLHWNKFALTTQVIRVLFSQNNILAALWTIYLLDGDLPSFFTQMMQPWKECRSTAVRLLQRWINSLGLTLLLTCILFRSQSETSLSIFSSVFVASKTSKPGRNIT